jgi:hypothetical protein
MGRGIIHPVMARKLFDGARGAAEGFADAARHLAWYLSYCVDGSSTRATEGGSVASEAPAHRRRRVS